MSSQTSPAADDRPLHLPLFYEAPEPLNSALHGEWRLKTGDAAFAADTPYVPIVLSELAPAARSYPIVFAGEDAQPIAVLGVERRNLFVEAGQWAPDTYVPAYVRRYPFGFIARRNPEGFVLAIDAASERLVRSGEEGVALFEDGSPAEITRQAVGFCEAFHGELGTTRAFTAALKAQDVLVDRRADVTLPDGRKLGLEGFQVVDQEKFSKLSDAAVLEWHGKGYLAAVQFHLSSLDRFQDLLNRRARS